MDELRWILLALAVLVIAGIYFFSRKGNADGYRSPLDAANDQPTDKASEDDGQGWKHGVGPVRVVPKDEYAENPVTQSQAVEQASVAEGFDNISVQAKPPQADIPSIRATKASASPLMNATAQFSASPQADDDKPAGPEDTRATDKAASRTHSKPEPAGIWDEHPDADKVLIPPLHSRDNELKAQVDAQQAQSTTIEGDNARQAVEAPTVQQTETETGSQSINTFNTTGLDTEYKDVPEDIAEQGQFSTDADKQPVDDVVAVYVLAPANAPLISGDKILSACYALNLHHGGMNIFHRFDKQQAIQFSMANIAEPGWFDIDKMAELETQGMSFFMQVTLVEQPEHVLDDMLICAHRMATMLEAQLCNAKRQPLDEASTNVLRGRVTQLLSQQASSPV